MFRSKSVERRVPNAIPFSRDESSPSIYARLELDNVFLHLTAEMSLRHSLYLLDLD